MKKGVARDKVQEVFPRQLAHEISRLLPGKTSGGDGGAE